MSSSEEEMNSKREYTNHLAMHMGPYSFPNPTSHSCSILLFQPTVVFCLKFNCELGEAFCICTVHSKIGPCDLDSSQYALL